MRSIAPSIRPMEKARKWNQMSELVKTFSSINWKWSCLVLENDAGKTSEQIVYVQCKQWNSKSFAIQFLYTSTAMISNALVATDRDKTSLESLKHSICCYNNTNCNYVRIAGRKRHRVSAVTSSIRQIEFLLWFLSFSIVPQFATIPTNRYMASQQLSWIFYMWTNKTFEALRIPIFLANTWSNVFILTVWDNGWNVEKFQ